MLTNKTHSTDHGSAKRGYFLQTLSIAPSQSTSHLFGSRFQEFSVPFIPTAMFFSLDLTSLNTGAIPIKLKSAMPLRAPLRRLQAPTSKSKPYTQSSCPRSSGLDMPQGQANPNSDCPSRLECPSSLEYNKLLECHDHGFHQWGPPLSSQKYCLLKKAFIIVLMKTKT